LIDIGYRALATRLHPDRGGSRSAFAPGALRGGRCAARRAPETPPLHAGRPGGWNGALPCLAQPFLRTGRMR
jgi:hypothetical protein